MLFIIEERANKAKHIQFVSGVNVLVFWGASFVWDFITVVMPAIGVLIMFAAFNTEAYSEGNRLGLVFLIFLLLGWAGIPFIYVLSRLFSTPAGGYAGPISNLLPQSWWRLTLVLLCSDLPGVDSERHCHADGYEQQQHSDWPCL